MEYPGLSPPPVCSKEKWAVVYGMILAAITLNNSVNIVPFSIVDFLFALRFCSSCYRPGLAGKSNLSRADWPLLLVYGERR